MAQLLYYSLPINMNEEADRQESSDTWRNPLAKNKWNEIKNQVAHRLARNKRGKKVRSVLQEIWEDNEFMKQTNKKTHRLSWKDSGFENIFYV